VLELARRNKVELPYADLEDLRGRYEFTDLQSFLDLIYANLTVLQTEEDFSELISSLQSGHIRAIVWIDYRACSSLPTTPKLSPKPGDTCN